MFLSSLFFFNFFFFFFFLCIGKDWLSFLKWKAPGQYLCCWKRKGLIKCGDWHLSQTNTFICDKVNVSVRQICFYFLFFTDNIKDESWIKQRKNMRCCWVWYFPLIWNTYSALTTGATPSFRQFGHNIAKIVIKLIKVDPQALHIDAPVVLPGHHQAFKLSKTATVYRL